MLNRFLNQLTDISGEKNGDAINISIFYSTIYVVLVKTIYDSSTNCLKSQYEHLESLSFANQKRTAHEIHKRYIKAFYTSH